MKGLIAALLFIALFGCVQKPAPVSSQTATVAPEDRLAIAVEYVAVPKMTVYARPDVASEVTGQYGLKEAISVLSRNGEWAEIRTFDGIGWVKQADLATAEQSDAVDTSVPRFYVEPTKVPFSTRGEIWIQARVNTDGEIIETKTTKNTTGMAALANANETALKNAKFYPMVDKGARKTFIYEHRVYY